MVMKDDFDQIARRNMLKHLFRDSIKVLMEHLRIKYQAIIKLIANANYH